jgi:hypothetical protein
LQNPVLWILEFSTGYAPKWTLLKQLFAQVKWLSKDVSKRVCDLHEELEEFFYQKWNIIWGFVELR